MAEETDQLSQLSMNIHEYVSATLANSSEFTLQDLKFTNLNKTSRRMSQRHKTYLDHYDEFACPK